MVDVESCGARQPMHIFLFQVLKPLQDRFKNIICQENFNRVFHEENIKLEIIDILESFIGKHILFCLLYSQLVIVIQLYNSCAICHVRLWTLADVFVTATVFHLQGYY
jgi:hypothetical protein